MPSGFFIHNEAHRYTCESVNGFIVLASLAGYW